MTTMGAKRGAEALPAEEMKPKRRNAKDLELQAEALKSFTACARTPHVEITKLLTETALKLVHAERASVWKPDVAQVLVTRTADGNEIRCGAQEGVVGRAYKMKLPVHIPQAYNDPDFNSNVDMETGFVTRSILCVPVISKMNEVLAVLQVLNAKKEFSESDERNLVILAQLSEPHLSVSCDVVVATVTALALSKDDKNVLSPQYDVFKSLANSDGDLRLVSLVVYLFDHFNLCSKFKIAKDTLIRFVLAVRSKYNCVAYHDFTHAFDVMQTASVFLEKGEVQHMVTDVDVLALLVSSLLHDVGHTGTTNDFHTDTNTPLGMLAQYSGATAGVLEVHHCHMALAILGSESTAIFAGIQSQGDLKYIYDSILTNILATDFAKHKQLFEQSQAFALALYDKENPEHRRMAMKMLLKAADISNVAKSFNLSRIWGLRVNQEFHAQGAKEKLVGLQPKRQFDGVGFGTHELAQSQKGFMDFVEPFFIALADSFPKLSYTLDNLRGNREQWHKVLVPTATRKR